MKNNFARSKTEFIDGFKVILCCMVAFGHFYNFLGGRYIYGIRLIGGMGARAVDVFFFLTAFLTMLSYRNRKRTAGSFIINKIKRLYPEYLPIILIAIFTVTVRSYFQKETLIYFTGNNVGAWGYEYNVRPAPDLRSILLHLIFCNGIIPCQEILGVTWSLPIEFWFYIVFMLVIFFTKGDERRDKKVFITLFIISVVAGVVLFSDGWIDHQHDIIRSLPIMFMGVIFADLYFGDISRKIGWLCTVVGIIYLFALDIKQNWMSVGIIVAIIILLVFDNSVLALFKGVMSGSFFKKGCRLSYSIYLLHTIVISFVFGALIWINSKAAILPNGGMIAVALIFSTIITIVCSALINRLAEYIVKHLKLEKK